MYANNNDNNDNKDKNDKKDKNPSLLACSIPAGLSFRLGFVRNSQTAKLLSKNQNQQK